MNAEIEVIPVRLGERTYEVAIGQGLLASAGQRLRDALGTTPARAFILGDANAARWVDQAEQALRDAGIAVDRFDITPTEAVKTLDTLEQVLDAVAASGLERSQPIVSVGGGIVGDIGGFAAATYRRGVPSIVCPTTLLSMVDASVGGKTGVNLRRPDGGLLKNMAGAFHQPSLVMADLAALETLGPRHRRSGMAECIKHAMLAGDHDDPDALQWVHSNAATLNAFEPDAICAWIVRGVRLKARVVEADEQELGSSTGFGGRASLNLGHTFAHAIEPIEELSPSADPSESPLHHGEAVGLGLIAATTTAAAAGLCDQAYADAIRNLIGVFGLPTSIRGLPANDDLRGRMMSDKKTRRGALRLVLPTGPGRVRIVDDCPAGAIDAGWDAIRC